LAVYLDHYKSNQKTKSSVCFFSPLLGRAHLETDVLFFFVTLERLVLSLVMLPKIHAATIFMLSIVLVMTLYFVDESTYSLAPLLRWNELRNFCFFAMFNTAFSLVLYAITVSTSYKRKSFVIALAGFLPVVGLIIWNLVN
jgi:hypothetical protein